METTDLILRPSIFEYSDPGKFFRDYFYYHKTKNPLYTTRALARNLGLKSHSLISHFIAGTRSIRPHHLERLAPRLKLSSEETKFFEIMVYKYNAKTSREKKFYESLLSSAHMVRTEKKISFDDFNIISNWYYMAILEMTELEGFREDPKWIRNRLFFPISTSQIQEALNRLIEKGLLVKKSGKLIKSHTDLTTEGAGKSEAIRSHHKQILELASQAVDQQNVDERILNCCAMTITTEKLPQVKNLIEEFRQRLSSLIEVSNGSESYELAIQFFKLTKKEEK